VIQQMKPKYGNESEDRDPTIEEIEGGTDDADSYYCAAWRYYRDYVGEQETEKRRAILSDNGISLRNMLLWASKRAFNAKEVSGNAERFQEHLQQDLLFVSASETDKRIVPHLWVNIFAPLLRMDSDADSERMTSAEEYIKVPSLSYDAVYQIVNARYPPPPEWPANVQALGHLLKGNLRNADILYDVKEFFPVFYGINRSIFYKLLKAIKKNGKWQAYLLQSGLDFPLKDVNVMDFLLGLKHLRNTNKQIQLAPNSDFTLKILAENERLFN